MKLLPTSVATLEKLFSTIPLFVSLYSRPYKKVLTREIKLASISKEDRVLNIGCGGIPFTSIYLHQLTKALVYAMDIDERALKRAYECLKRMKLEKKIILYHGDGSREIPVDFTVALVALQARPKEGILKMLLERAGPTSRFIFRLPRKEFQNIYGTLLRKDAFSTFVHQEMKTFDRSVLLTPETLGGADNG